MVGQDERAGGESLEADVVSEERQNLAARLDPLRLGLTAAVAGLRFGTLKG
jgi:hypothetical protein